MGINMGNTISLEGHADTLDTLLFERNTETQKRFLQNGASATKHAYGKVSATQGCQLCQGSEP
jgi:hypothetical protein